MRIRVGVQAEPKDVSSWLDLARRLDAGPFDSLMLGDHPGSGASPWPALGAAAAVTGGLRLGTYVSQAGVRDPLQVAADAASLDVLAPARVRLGVGAGHTPAEWTATGLPRPSAADRSARLDEFIRIVSGLLAGRTVSLDGKFLTVHDAKLQDLGQFAGRVSLTVGGASAAVLATAARHADIVAISGLGKTMPDGHRHEILGPQTVSRPTSRASERRPNGPEPVPRSRFSFSTWSSRKTAPPRYKISPPGSGGPSRHRRPSPKRPTCSPEPSRGWPSRLSSRPIAGSSAPTWSAKVPSR